MVNSHSNHRLKNQLNSIKNTWNFKTKIQVLLHSAVIIKFKIDKTASATNQMILLLDGNSWWIIMKTTEIMEICRFKRMEEVPTKRIKMLDSLELSVTRKLQQMITQASSIEQLIWMTLMQKTESKSNLQILEILTIWSLKRNFFNSSF
jgi:hypothetical protein